ncbi:hypothetical protein BASA81_003633 [Batrachochytrium salamandrivorans]|nr:hypothetical protein BASA81_003633 [Batrachochytrium salamandrivorans]
MRGGPRNRTLFIPPQIAPTSLVGMYVLWGLNLVEIVWVLYTTLYVITARVELFLETRKKNPTATLWKNKGLLMLVQGPLIHAVLKGNLVTRRLVKINYVCNFFVSAMSILVGALPFVTLGQFVQNGGNTADQIAIMRAYYFAQASCLLINAMQALVVKRMIFKALDRVHGVVTSSDNKTAKIKQKLVGFKIQL